MRLAAKIALTSEILLAYASARRGLARDDLPATLRTLRQRTQAGAGRPQDVPEAAWLGGHVGRVLRTLPTDDRCLIQSLVTLRLLDRRDVPSTLVIGVRPGETFAAHAWVEVDGRAVLPPGDFGRLTEL